MSEDEKILARRLRKRLYMRQKRLEWRAKGICIICGVNKVLPGKTTCLDCGMDNLRRARIRQNVKKPTGSYLEGK